MCQVTDGGGDHRINFESVQIGDEKILEGSKELQKFIEKYCFPTKGACFFF